MSTAAVTGTAPARPRPAPGEPTRRTRAAAPRKRRTSAQRHLAGGVVWIGLLAVLLAGVVAMNVAVLRLNLRLDELAQEQAGLRAENAEIASRLAGAAASVHIQGQAHERLGLVPVAPDQTSYVRLRPSNR